MWEQYAPLIALALAISGGILSAVFLFWHLSADTLRGDRIKRTNKGRRRSDQ